MDYRAYKPGDTPTLACRIYTENPKAGENPATTSCIVTITSSNKAPRIAPIGNVTLKQGFGSYSMLIKAWDPDGDKLTYSAHTSEDANFTVTVTGRELTIKEMKGKWGEGDVTVKVSDDENSTMSTFHVTVKKVEEPKLPEIDEEFAKAFGVESGDVEQLKKEIRDNMERELNKRLRVLLKENVMDALLAANPVDVPSAIVREEAENLKKQMEAQGQGSGLDVELFMDEAKRRVQLGMLLAEVAKMASLNIDADAIKERIEEMSKDYDDPEEFVRYYMSNQELLGGVQTLVMEDKVVDWIAEQAKVSESNKTFDEVMNPEAAK